MSSAEIAIRQIQHYLYCPHRWGLIEIDKAWTENYFVAKANLMHERVHDEKAAYKSRGKRTYTAVSVYNDNEPYNLYGVTDCIEVEGDADLYAYRNQKRFQSDLPNIKVCIVEYKPTKPKNAEFRIDDLMQVFAQKICVDYVFSCNCDAEIYYADVKRRYKLPLRENFNEYDDLLRKCLQEMREHLKSGNIPAVLTKQKCSGCSMKDLCMSKLKMKSDIKTKIRELNAKAKCFSDKGGEV